LNVEKSVNGLTLKGESRKTKDGSIIIEGTLNGEIEVECIKCLKNYKKVINEEINFKIVKPPYKGFDEKYDIIEMENFNIEDVLKSEIESVKNDYNICESCQKEEFNKEF
jgi:uncharacterized metal-binding protein YceD (DUF177 family)